MERVELSAILFTHFSLNDKRFFERIFKTFDIEKDGVVSRGEWVRGMSIFLLGTGQEQILYCFTVYDMNGDGFITKEEMTTLLQDCLKMTGLEEEGEDGLKVRSLSFEEEIKLFFFTGSY